LKDFNFEEDLKKELSEGFSAFHVKLPYRKNIHNFLVDYLTISKKLVPLVKRGVHYNPDFLIELDTHPRKKEIILLERFFSTCQNVNFFQSKRLFQSGFHDHLVYEWNIFHFHLSLEKEHKSRFVKQVKQLLFVFVSDKKSHFYGY